MAGMWAELQIAWRGLLKARGYTTAVLATLGLAIALESVVVAVVNAYLVRSLPYPAATRLYSVSYARPGESFPTGLAGPEWDARCRFMPTGAAVGSASRSPVLHAGTRHGRSRLFMVCAPLRGPRHGSS